MSTEIGIFSKAWRSRCNCFNFMLPECRKAFNKELVIRPPKLWGTMKPRFSEEVLSTWKSNLEDQILSKWVLWSLILASPFWVGGGGEILVSLLLAYHRRDLPSLVPLDSILPFKILEPGSLTLPQQIRLNKTESKTLCCATLANNLILQFWTTYTPRLLPHLSCSDLTRFEPAQTSGICLVASPGQLQDHTHIHIMNVSWWQKNK